MKLSFGAVEIGSVFYFFRRAAAELPRPIAVKPPKAETPIFICFFLAIFNNECIKNVENNHL